MGMHVNTATEQELQESGGSFVDQPGTYHVNITNVEEGIRSDGKPDNAFFFQFEILAGTTKGQEGRSMKETVFMPKSNDDADRQKRSKSRVTAFLIATCLLKIEDLGKPIDFDATQAIGRQIVVKIDRKNEQQEDGSWKPGKYFEVPFSNIFHVDSPSASGIPKNEKALALIESNLRKPESYFSSSKKPGGSAEKQQEQAAAEDTKSQGSGLF